MYEPLPSEDEVRCRLALDLPMQIHGMLDLRDLAQSTQYHEAQMRKRDSTLMDRLAGVVPRAEIERASEDDGLNLEVLSNRVPAVYAMWVMITALTAQQVEVELTEFERTR